MMGLAGGTARRAHALARWIRRLVTGTGRRVRAPRTAVFLLLVAAVAAAAGAWWVWDEATRAPSAARTLVLAREAAGKPLELTSPLAVEWEDALRAAAVAPESWTELLAPVLPPPICPAETGGLALTGERGALLRAAVLDGESSLRRGDGAGMRAAMDRLAGEVGREPGGASDFVARYGLARLHAAQEDGGAALRLVEPVFDGVAGVRFAARGDAPLLVASGRVDTEAAILAAHARALAGYAALARGAQPEAVLHYRLGINHAQYPAAAVLGPELSGLAPARSVSLPLGEASCGVTNAQPLTTVDLRAGLIAAYAADSTFRDPPRLRSEVARGPAGLDAGDPLAPLLRHAQDALRQGERPAVPEHVIWAASNLQTAFRDNRLAPDGRLELTRSVLALRVASAPEWLDALGVDRDGCGVLGPLGADLVRQWQALPVNGGARSAVDSARAAVALRALAMQKVRCAQAGAQPEADVRGLWIRLAASRLPGTLAGAYEERRMAVERALTADGPIEEEVEAALGDASRQLAILRRGRLPANLPAHLDATITHAFVERWWRTLFADAARTLAASGRSAGELRSADAPRFLDALNASVVHAGVVPSAVFNVDEFAPLAAAAGWAPERVYRARYFALDRPGAAVLALLLALVAVVGVLVVVHVNVWRYRLLVRDRFYAAERRASGRLRAEAKR